jgi:choline dehydrogenase-like flavoprotein
MLDAGVQLEKERLFSVSKVAETEFSDWNQALLAPLKEGVEASPKGIPLKRLYGSDYPFRHVEQGYAIEKDGVDLLPSFALGGFSTIWGAGMLPFHQSDISDWPVTAHDLAPHYKAVFDFLPCSATNDDLAPEFPIYASHFSPLKPSRQAAAFLEQAAKHREPLRNAGITVGGSRLAVSAEQGGKPACIYCGMCLYGCPHRLIYCSDSTIRAMQREPNFRYRPGVVVEHFHETGERVMVHGRDRASGERVQMEASRLFIAAGVVPTTAITLRSLDAVEREVTIQDSTYFLMPLLQARPARGVASERLHTLAQAFVVIKDSAICEEYLHLSIYAYNDLMEPALRMSGGPAGKGLDAFWKRFAEHVLIGGGYLHSKHSPAIKLTLHDSPDGAPAKISLRAAPSQEYKRKSAKLGWKLLKHARHLGVLPLVPFIRHSLPGRGFHCGGSFPMTKERREFASDTLGRPWGLTRVHLVDASCFPSVPATTVTLPAMANAHRIASEAARL